MTTLDSDVYYDPYDFEIDANPYPVWKRLRDERPLYTNERYGFFALSRFEDVERGLIDWQTFISSRGTVLELIKANAQMPAGMIIFEDPPNHGIYRALLSRLFTPRKINALEPKVRRFCAQCLDPLVGTGRFDFIADLGAQMPMRTIGMLLGIPEEDQEAHPRQHRRRSAPRIGRDARRRGSGGLRQQCRARWQLRRNTSTGAPNTPPTI